MRPKVVILASGGGTTAEAFIRASARREITAEVAQIIVSRADAGIFDRIALLNQELGLAIDCTLINYKTYPAAAGETVERGFQSMAERRAIIDLIRSAEADLVVLMGYMKRIGPEVVTAFGWHTDYTSQYQAMMLNTHPGLLPETKGLYGRLCQERVLELGLTEAGQTLHVVSSEYDDGPVVAQHRVQVAPDDTPESLFERIQTVEKQYIAPDIESFIKGRQAYLNGGA